MFQLYLIYSGIMRIDPRIHKKISFKCAIVIALLAAALTAMALPAVAQEIDTLSIVSKQEIIVKELPD